MISFLLAMDEQRLIGKNNDLPWHLPADLKYFKQTTLGHPIVMGRKTFKSIGKALPGRKNVVLTGNEAFEAEGCTVVHSVSEALEAVKEDDEVFVIGGAKVFDAFQNHVNRLYITLIHHTFEGDTYFPEVKKEEWKLVSRKEGPVDECNHYPHEFLIYEKLN